MGALKESKIVSRPELKAHDGGLEEHIEYEPSGIFKRFVAVFIDGVVLGAINLILQKVAQGIFPMPSQEQMAAGNTEGMGVVLGVGFGLSLIFNVGYYVFTMKKWSATPGKKLLGLKVIRIGENKEWSFGAIFLREVIGKTVSSLGMLGYLWAFFGEKKQAWHDKMVKSMVVKDQ